MKTILWIRHAKSSWLQPQLSDHDRPLNERGHRDAPIMAERLRVHGHIPQLLVSSSALRAHTTAQIFAQVLVYPPEDIFIYPELYSATSVQETFDWCKGLPDTINTVALFGHNPLFTEIHNTFAPTPTAEVPTCSITCTQFPTASWKGLSLEGGNLVYFDYPKNSVHP